VLGGGVREAPGLDQGQPAAGLIRAVRPAPLRRISAFQNKGSTSQLANAAQRGTPRAKSGPGGSERSPERPLKGPRAAADRYGD
jgi:hypothetical protein